MEAGAVPTMLYVSYRGEQDAADASPEPPQQNLDVVDQQGYAAQNVLQTALPPGTALDELRGICFGADGYLWVASAAKTTSLILRFQAHANDDGVHEYKDCVASAQLLDAVNHPFDIAFQPVCARMRARSRHAPAEAPAANVLLARTRALKDSADTPLGESKRGCSRRQPGAVARTRRGAKAGASAPRS